jgi:hypothetical protein
MRRGAGAAAGGGGAPRAMAALRTIQGRAQQVCPRTVASIVITVVMVLKHVVDVDGIRHRSVQGFRHVV